MSIIQLKWEVANLTALLAAGYDELQVHRAAAEITRSNTRIPLTANIPNYVWQSPTGAITDTFEYVPYRTSDATIGPAVAITDKTIHGYCVIQDMRDEGYAPAAYTDERIQGAIDQATELIDQVCGQRFVPYYSVVRLNVKKLYDEHHLDVPIVALFKVTDGDESLPLTDVLVYNRHLTSGMTNPDDRKNPMIAWGEDRELQTTNVFSSGRFERGRKTLRLWGIWGFTELGAGDEVGETADDSQIPLSYGQTPKAIKRACMLLTAQYLPTVATGGDPTAASRLIEEKTIDQSYKLSPLSSAESSFGMTGNLEVDNILMRFVCPMRIGAV